MSNAAAISVVVPLFNNEKTVARCLSSILGQSFDDLDLIVVDDGSTDESAAVVESFSDPRVRLVHQENAGPAAARNRGVRSTHADLIAFLDADDEWMPSYLETIWSLSHTYPAAGILATNCLVREAQQTWIPTSKHLPPRGETDRLDRYFRICAKVMPFGPSCCAVRRSVLERIGGFRESMRYYEDLDAFARIAVSHPIIYRNETHSTYYNASALRDPRPSVENRRQVIETLTEVRARASRRQRSDIDYLIATLLVGEAATFVANGKGQTARALLRRSPGSLLVRPGMWGAVLALSLMPAPLVQIARAARRAHAGRPFDRD